MAVTQCSTVSTASFWCNSNGYRFNLPMAILRNGSTWNDYADATSSTLTVDAPATYAEILSAVVSGTAPCTAVTSNTSCVKCFSSFRRNVHSGYRWKLCNNNCSSYLTTMQICFSDNVVFNLTDATYSQQQETFPIVINQNANIGAYTLTIKPAWGVSPTISGTSTAAIVKVNGQIM